MPRTAPKSQWQTLRRYLRAGNSDTARDLLERMVRRYPHDAEAAAELERMRAGHPLRIAETESERGSRQRQTAHAELLRLIAQTTRKRPAAIPSARLRRLHDTARAHLLTLQRLGEAPPEGSEAAVQAMEHELHRRRKRRMRALLYTLGAGALILLPAAGGLLHMQSRAHRLSEELTAACKSGDWARSEQLLMAADTGIYRLLSSKIEPAIIRAKRWRASVLEQAQSLSRTLDGYESRGKVTDAELAKRAEFLRQLRALPRPLAAPLLARWEALCRPVQAELDAQKAAVASELTELPTMPELTLDAAQDAAMLEGVLRRLQQHVRLCRDAREAFGLETPASEASEQLAAQAKALLSEATQLLRLENRLSSALTFDAYRLSFADFAPSLYPPALAAAKAWANLPAAEETEAAVRAQIYGLPHPMPPAERQAILEGGPSFCQTHPATQAQVHLMEDAFTSRTLRTRLYEVTNPDGLTRYTENAPVVTPKGSVVFTVSELDPAHRPGPPERVEWRPAHSIWIRTLDPTPLMRAAGMERETFFAAASVPHLLGRITGVQAGDCPALAKAYLYHTLLELMRLHNSPGILGLRYSPTLQADAESFRQLVERCDLELTPTCWLERSGKAQQAEALYARWFADHAQRDYAAEMQRELAALLRRKPRYAGYADASGRPHYTLAAPAGSKLWYYTAAGLNSGEVGAPLRDPAPYSPLFIE